MTDLETSEIVLLLLGGLLVFAAFSYVVSLSAAIAPIRKLAQEEKSVRIVLSIVLGFVVFLSVFLVITRWLSATYYDSPPHGVVMGVWDDFENQESGAVFLDEKTEEELDLNDTLLAQITFERFRRYLLPPPLRHQCFTGNRIGCHWSDIDLANFEDKQEWIDFFIRVTIGIVLGFMTGFLAWLHTEGKETLQPSKAA